MSNQEPRENRGEIIHGGVKIWMRWMAFFTNTTTATDDYFKESITANVTIPIAVLKELMGMKQREPEKATTPETKYEGIPETIQWFRPQDKTPAYGTKCICIFETDSGLMCACAVAGHASDYLYGSELLYWAHIPKGPKGE